MPHLVHEPISRLIGVPASPLTHSIAMPGKPLKISLVKYPTGGVGGVSAPTSNDSCAPLGALRLRHGGALVCCDGSPKPVQGM